MTALAPVLITNAEVQMLFHIVEVASICPFFSPFMTYTQCAIFVYSAEFKMSVDSASFFLNANTLKLLALFPQTHPTKA